MARAARAVDVGARGKRIDASVLAPKVKQHQLAAVVQLRAEPVPADLVRRELVGEEFMVHPGQPGNGVALAFEPEGAGSAEPRLREVVGSPPGPCRFLADPVLPMD